MSGGTVSPTPLQAAWLPTRQAIDYARTSLDADAWGEYLAYLAILTAHFYVERLEQS
jgi:hypothetical protein